MRLHFFNITFLSIVFFGTVFSSIILNAQTGMGESEFSLPAVVDLHPIDVNIDRPNPKPIAGPVSADAYSGGTNISKDIFDDTASKREQLPENASTPSDPSYSAGKDDAIGETVKGRKEYFRLSFGDSIFDVTSRLRLDSLYGVNLRYLNNKNNEEDPQLDK